MIPKASPPSRLKMNFTPTKPSSSTSPWPMTLYAMFLNRRLIVPPSPGSASGQLGRADVRIPRQHQSRDEDSDRVAWAGYEHPEVAHPPWWLALDAGYEGPVLGGDEVGHQRGVRTRERAQVAEVPVGLARLESLDLREVWWWAVAVVQALDVLALIGLQVYGPVAGAPGESDVGLLRQHHAAFALGHVPDGPERLDLRVADPGHEVPSAIVAVADAHDQLVHQREQRLDALVDRIPVLDGIAHDREAGDLHEVG